MPPLARPKRIPTALLLPLLASLWCCGCGSSTTDIPRTRIGALPFPGMLTLYKTADPAHLGTHRYEREPRYFEEDETERGILYTSEAGFLDLAHIRLAIDWTRYCTNHVRRALELGQSEVVMNGSNGSMFHVMLRVPADWPQPRPLGGALADAGDFAVAGASARGGEAAGSARGGEWSGLDEMSLEAGEWLAYLMLTWHEFAQWYGDRSVFFIDEQPSAFTWDDVMSHVIGIRIGDRAMRDRSRPYNAAVTAALDAEFRAIGAVPPEQTDRAVRAIEGHWWADGQPLKRQLDTGLDNGTVVPWLVPGLPFSSPFPPRPLAVLGYRAALLGSVRVEPQIAAAERMRQHLPGYQPGSQAGPNEWIDADRDFPILLREMGAEMRQQFGPDVDQPWPAKDGGPTGSPGLVVSDGSAGTRPATPRAETQRTGP